MIIPDDNVAPALTFADRYMDLQGLSVYSGLGKTTLRRHIRDNGLPFFKVDGKLVVRQSEYDRWLQQRYRGKGVDLDAIADTVVKELLRGESDG